MIGQVSSISIGAGVIFAPMKDALALIGRRLSPPSFHLSLCYYRESSAILNFVCILAVVRVSLYLRRSLDQEKDRERESY